MKKRIILACICLLTLGGQASGQYLKKGFWGGFELDYGLGLSDKGQHYRQNFGSRARMQMVGLRTVFGYYITPSFSLGTGIGVTTHSHPRNNMIPIFLDIRYHPITRINENLYINLNFGTALANNQSDMNTKFIWEFALGYKLFDIGNFTLTPAIGYNYMKYDKEIWSEENDFFIDCSQKRRTLFFRLSLTY